MCRNDSKGNGARKVALFLSALETETSERILALFEPEVAQAIADEAKTIRSVVPEEVESVVSDFLNSVDNALAADLKGAHFAQMGETAAGQGCADIRSNEDAAFHSETLSSLDAIAPHRLASLLTNERPATIAAALSTLSPSRRASLVKLLPPDTQSLVSHMTMKRLSSRAHTRLEDVLFERALDDER